MNPMILEELDANVFTVDWSKGSWGLNYFQVVSNTRIVGAEIARFIKFLIKNGHTQRNRIHLIGQSLGAHIVSYTAENVTDIAKITALDPAQPGFENEDEKVRLDKGDAGFVKVIHTNANPFIPKFGLGMMKPIGHVDFFMNGGARQPGCYLNRGVIGNLLIIPIRGSIKAVSCSHMKSYEYYIEALQSECLFWGVQWTPGKPFPKDFKCTLKNCQEMVKYTHLLPGRGTFFVETNAKPPFCKLRTDIDRNVVWHIAKGSEKYGWSKKCVKSVQDRSLNLLLQLESVE